MMTQKPLFVDPILERRLEMDFHRDVLELDALRIKQKYNVDISEEDSQIAEVVYYAEKKFSERKLPMVISRKGDWLFFWTWCCRYVLVWSADASLKRLKVSYGKFGKKFPEHLEWYFYEVYSTVDKLYGWNAPTK